MTILKIFKCTSENTEFFDNIDYMEKIIVELNTKIVEKTLKIGTHASERKRYYKISK